MYFFIFLLFLHFSTRNLNQAEEHVQTENADRRLHICANWTKVSFPFNIGTICNGAMVEWLETHDFGAEVA